MRGTAVDVTEMGSLGQRLWSYVPVRPGAFRLFLALLVFAHHCSRLGLGKYAVYVFFVLSGFWVDRMWTARYRLTQRPYLTYLISRAWRLLPTFVLVGAIVTALSLLIGVDRQQMAGDDSAHLLASSLFILGYSRLDYLPIGPGWSLDIEVQYYLIAPVLALVARRWSLAALTALMAAVSVLSASAMTSPVLPSYLAFFAAGLVASAFGWRPSPRLAAASALVVLVLLIGLAISPWRGALLGGARLTPLFAWNPLLNIGAALLTIPFALYTTTQPSDARDRMQADLSYIVYLAHWPVFLWLSAIGGSVANRLPYLVVGWVAVLAGSWVVWRWFDRPINAARARWVTGQLKKPAASVAREPTAY